MCLEYRVDSETFYPLQIVLYVVYLHVPTDIHVYVCLWARVCQKRNDKSFDILTWS